MITLSNYADTIKNTIKSIKINLTNIFYMITINYIFKIQKENVMNKQAMFNLSYGLYILTAKDSQKDNGCIVNTVMQVTETPNQIIAAVNKLNYTHDLISKTGEFNVSILSQDSKFQTYKHWGFQSGTNAFISAKVISVSDLGTHSLFLAEVTDSEILSDSESVTYSYYHKNIKPKSDAQEKKKGFICKVCGYIYEGETLPEDFICPWCKHPASDFEPIK